MLARGYLIAAVHEVHEDEVRFLAGQVGPLVEGTFQALLFDLREPVVIVYDRYLGDRTIGPAEAIEQFPFELRAEELGQRAVIRDTENNLQVVGPVGLGVERGVEVRRQKAEGRSQKHKCALPEPLSAAFCLLPSAFCLSHRSLSRSAKKPG